MFTYLLLVTNLRSTVCVRIFIFMYAHTIYMYKRILAEAHATTRGSSHQREALVVTSFLLERIMSGEKHYRASERIKTRKASRPNMHRQHATVTLSCAGLSALHDDGECQALVSMFVDERRAEKYGFEFIGQTELSEYVFVFSSF